MGNASSNSIVHTINLGKQVISPEGELIILKDINITISKGKSVAIVGASGSGKSTLLGIMAGLDTSTSGEVYLLSKKLGSLNEDQRASLRAGNVGFVFQSFQLLPHLTALENVMLPLELAREKDAGNKARQALINVGLKSRTRHMPSQLSGGEQQRVAIARAYAVQPKILFADEPTGNLDQVTGKHIIDLLFDLNKIHNTTLVMVTHDTELSSHCDSSFKLNEGQLCG